MAKRYHNSKNKSAMIHEDASAPCLLPQGVIESYYPNPYHYQPGVGVAFKDLYTGVEQQLMQDGADKNRIMKPKKY